MHKTIKSLVLDYVHRHSGIVDYEALTEQVKKHFPKSRWKKTHWAWYRYQICRGRFRDEFSDTERAALGADTLTKKTRGKTTRQRRSSRGPAARDAEIKQIGDAILTTVRVAIADAAGDDADKHFRLNRWVYLRLMLDERRAKRPLKDELWKRGIQSCQVCGKPFSSLKGVELHREDESLGYSVENCRLLCRECQRKQ